MKLVCVMYHFVRPRDDRFPRMNTVTPEIFSRQLDWLTGNFEPVGIDAIIGRIRSGKPLPERAFTLTFDHATRDHLDFALPELSRRGLPGAFYVIAATPETGCVPAIDKQRFCEAAYPAAESFTAEFCASAIRLFPEKEALLAPTPENVARAGDYLGEYAFYTPHERFIRKMRDSVLTYAEFERCIEGLFRDLFGDEGEFAGRHYLDWAALGEIRSRGMHVGSHGYEHIPFDRCECGFALDDVRRSFELIERQIGGDAPRTLAYPNGACRDGMFGGLARLGVQLCFTAQFDVAPPEEKPFGVGRADAADVPPLGDGRRSLRTATFRPGS